MTEPPVERLPRGRHGLSRDEVVASQRRRMLIAMADAMMDKGYVDTSVADVIKRAGVSRETFYQQFSSKADCFRRAYDAAGEVLFGTVTAEALQGMPPSVPSDPDTAVEHPTAADGTGGQDARLAQFDLALRSYLGALAANPAYARLFLVEVYAAGPDAVRTRLAMQDRIVDGLCAQLGVTSDHGRFACKVLIAAVGSMVTEPLMAGRPEALHYLHRPIVDLVRRALQADGA